MKPGSVLVMCWPPLRRVPCTCLGRTTLGETQRAHPLPPAKPQVVADIPTFQRLKATCDKNDACHHEYHDYCSPNVQALVCKGSILVLACIVGQLIAMTITITNFISHLTSHTQPPSSVDYVTYELVNCMHGTACALLLFYGCCNTVALESTTMPCHHSRGFIRCS